MKSLQKFLNESLSGGEIAYAFTNYYDSKKPDEIADWFEAYFIIANDIIRHGYFDAGSDEASMAIDDVLDKIEDMPLFCRNKDFDVSVKGKTVKIFYQTQGASPREMMVHVGNIISIFEFNKYVDFEIEIWDRSGNQETYKIDKNTNLIDFISHLL